ncbi:GDP-mannose pyrophosphatase [Burkholderia multivorans]|uniref:GDP-mannose pyrophosphatase n=1 Tax=Burkholderia multivorans TaxID=87883 RepID=UPI001C23D826|nr:GDP-mannose pyrophosphatase [Burkholderia multivorans]MBU9126890.1 GDP-mannose pyrophosphatase [Burkholderia multivorans]
MRATRDRVRIVESTVLSDNWYTLTKVTFDFLRRDGTWQRQSRETYDRGNGATILLYCRHTGNVVLTRQFRMPVFVNGHDGMLIEAAAGLLDNATPEERIRQEAEEETGYRVNNIRKVFEAYEVLEMPLRTALRLVRSGEIVDGKTIMLLQHLALSEIMEGRQA